VTPELGPWAFGASARTKNRPHREADSEPFWKMKRTGGVRAALVNVRGYIRGREQEAVQFLATGTIREEDAGTSGARGRANSRREWPEAPGLSKKRGSTHSHVHCFKDRNGAGRRSKSGFKMKKKIIQEAAQARRNAEAGKGDVSALWETCHVHPRRQDLRQKGRNARALR